MNERLYGVLTILGVLLLLASVRYSSLWLALLAAVLVGAANVWKRKHPK